MARFDVVNPRLVAVELVNEKVLALSGSMVAYEGDVKFDKAILGGEGLFGAFKRAVTKEGLSMMGATGTGKVYFANEARDIGLIPLSGDRVWIESSALLAYDSGLKTNVAFAGLRGATSGQGLFTTTVEGTGTAAVMADGELLALEVTPSEPLFVDPDAFVGYKGQITQEFVFDVNWKTMIGQSSGETYQLKFSGTGEVYVQPSERK